MTYFGPSGSGDGRNPVGCKGFFRKLNSTEMEMDQIKSSAGLFQEFMSSKRGGNDRAKKNSTLADRLFEFIIILCSAFKLSE
jgi:hypothetical protein